MLSLQIIIFLLGLFLWFVIFFNVKYKRMNKDLALFGSAFAIVLIIFSLFPGLAYAIAKFFKVSRATDLFVYIMIPFLFYVELLLYTKIRDVQSKFTEFIRREAINEFKRKYQSKFKE